MEIVLNEQEPPQNEDEIPEEIKGTFGTTPLHNLEG